MKILFLFAFAICLVDSIPVEEDRQEREYVEPEYLDHLYQHGEYEEFSRLLGISNPRLSMPRNPNDLNDPSSLGPSFIRGLFEGDILLTPEEEESARQGMSFTSRPSYQWPGIIPFVISSNFSSTVRASILKGIELWNANFSKCLIWVARTNEANYVFIFPGDGCYSYLGRIGGQQALSLSPTGCMRLGTIHHEMCHASGIIHEQSRPDRDNFMTVLFDNILVDWHPQYRKESSSSFMILGAYECGSCMHYPNAAPGTNKPAFEWINGSCPDKSKVGQRYGLTELDTSKLRKLYSC